MTFQKQFGHMMVLAVGLVGITGCTSVNRLATRMDMVVGHIAEPGKLVYEGELVAIKDFGSMTALQFDGGKMYDVVAAAPGLLRGDVVRIYQTRQGYEARLWQARPDPTVEAAAASATPRVIAQNVHGQ